MLGFVGDSFIGLFVSFYNLGYAILHPSDWLDWSNKDSLINFIYYGASAELLHLLMAMFIVVVAIGLWRRPFLWVVLRVLEFFGNWVGRIFAWAGLFMVLQQVIIIFLQRIFRVAEVSISPFGLDFTKDLSWYSEELKLYNAMIVCLCCAYTFIQGGHVRVDLFYAGMKFRTKRFVDMCGSLFFMFPVMCIVWMYAWFFLWRHLVTPKIASTDKIEVLARKARLLKWNVETIGFSPSGFDAYFLFKVLIVCFAGMMLLHSLTFFIRSLLEYIEGDQSENKHLDKDILSDVTIPTQAETR